MADIINRYITKNPYFNDGKWIYAVDLEGFMLHSVGVGQPDPWVFINSWDRANYTNAGINGFVGADATYLTAPCLETASRVKRMPHGGKWWVNDHYIGFEMTEPAEIKYTAGDRFTISNLAAAQAHVRKTYANSVDLFAKLCLKHGKDPLKPGVIISHNEGWKQGVASTHSDPEHLWTQLKLPFTMDGFRQDVWNKMNNKEEIEMTEAQVRELIRSEIKAAQTAQREKSGSNWSEADRDWAVENGLIKGSGELPNGDPNYMWQDNMTREQAVAILHRMADKFNLKISE